MSFQRTSSTLLLECRLNRHFIDRAVTRRWTVVRNLTFTTPSTVTTLDHTASQANCDSNSRMRCWSTVSFDAPRLDLSLPRSCWSIQVRNDLVATSSFLLAANVRPYSKTKLIASRLNSSVKYDEGYVSWILLTSWKSNINLPVHKNGPRSV